MSWTTSLSTGAVDRPPNAGYRDGIEGSTETFVASVVSLKPTVGRLRNYAEKTVL